MEMLPETPNLTWANHRIARGGPVLYRLQAPNRNGKGYILFSARWNDQQVNLVCMHALIYLYSLRSELLVSEMDISRTKIRLDTSIYATSNSDIICFEYFNMHHIHSEMSAYTQNRLYIYIQFIKEVRTIFVNGGSTKYDIWDSLRCSYSK